MDLIKKIKIKKQDGTFTDYISIGAEASNVFMKDGNNVDSSIGKLQDLTTNNKENLVSAINESQEDINNLSSREGLYIGSYFIGDTNPKLQLIVSKDGVSFSRIKTNVDYSFRDPSLTYIKGTYYIAYTNNGNNRDFSIAKSTDLMNWSIIDLTVGLSEYPTVWAPEWFIDDNGEIYLFISAGTHTTTTQNMSLFKIKCIDINNFIFESPEEIQTNSSEYWRIDPYVMKLKDTYYLIYTTWTTTSQTEKIEICKIYSSKDLINWTLVNNDVFGKYHSVEGCCMTYQNGSFTIYGDMINSNNYYIYIQTDDLSNTNKIWYTNESLNDLRHGTLFYTQNKDILETIYNLPNTNINYIYKKQNLFGQTSIDSDRDILTIQPNQMYVFRNGVHINYIANPFRLRSFPFLCTGTPGDDYNIVIDHIQNAEGIMNNYTRTIAIDSWSKIGKSWDFLLLADCFIPFIG